MPYPNSEINDNVFLDPTTEKVSDGWTVFKKMKDAINSLISARGTANGVPSLGADSKIPIEQIPDAAVNPNLGSKIEEIVGHTHGATAPDSPIYGQIWHDSTSNTFKSYSADGWQPIGRQGLTAVTDDAIESSRTIVLKKGTYYLIPVGGDGSPAWNNGTVSGFAGVNGNNGGTTTIELNGFTSTCRGGVGGTTQRIGGSLNGTISTTPPEHIATATSFFGFNAAGVVPLLDVVSITTDKTATITIGAGGAAANSASSAGRNGWCAIWKVS